MKWERQNEREGGSERGRRPKIKSVREGGSERVSEKA